MPTTMPNPVQVPPLRLDLADTVRDRGLIRSVLQECATLNLEFELNLGDKKTLKDLLKCQVFYFH